MQPDRALALLGSAVRDHCPDGVVLWHSLSPSDYAELLTLLRDRREATAALIATVDEVLRQVAWHRVGDPASLVERLRAAAQRLRDGQ